MSEQNYEVVCFLEASSREGGLSCLPKDRATWTGRLGRTNLRSFTDDEEEGHFWLEQNAAKGSKWGNSLVRATESRGSSIVPAAAIPAASASMAKSARRERQGKENLGTRSWGRDGEQDRTYS
jgi:hypothetical protein